MSDENTPQPEFTPSDEQIIAASELIDIAFTPEEREQMVAKLGETRDGLNKIRRTHIPNDIAPATQLRLQAMPDQQALTEVNYSSPAGITRPNTLEDVAFWSVTHLAELLRTQQVTSVELTMMYLERLRRYNEFLECVITFTDDRAMQQAQQADTEIKAGNYRGPLHGIPWGAKDLLAVKGYPTTWGTKPYQDQAFDFDATVVQRLDEAGAVLIAKLTLGELAYGDVWFDGTTKNPWDISEGSSGSSAGSASAVAAGLVGFAIGSETYGSIVSPCTRCGATGLRPTFGRVSRYGAMALAWSLDKLGPIARSVEDSALIFAAIHGADTHDPHAIDASFAWSAQDNVKALRVGYLASAFEEERDNKATDDAVLQTLREIGFELVPVELPEWNNAIMWTILISEAAAAFDELTRNSLDDQMKRQDADAWPNLFRSARFIPAVEYIQANRIRTQLMQDIEALMQGFDVLVAPSFAPTLPITNLTGHPCVVVPNGFSEKGTPTSISFMGGLFKDQQVLQVAKAYQDATPFHQQHPPLEFDDLRAE